MDSRAWGKALGCGPTARLLMAALWTVWAAAAAGGPGDGPLPAFHEIDHVPVKKQRFIAYLLPVVGAENGRIGAQRSRLLGMMATHESDRPLGWMEARFLAELAREYRVDPGGLTAAELMNALVHRVDVIPHSMVLAQAAKESGWGASRLARRANNLFGQWCFEPGCGVVPRRRSAGLTHEIRSFHSVRESVASYLRNLNTHHSYRRLRALRAELRRQGRPLSGMHLAEGLIPYSERGYAYVREVQTLIRQNGLEAADAGTVISGS